MKTKPLVSVCIPTYNRAAMLKEAMESVLAQTFNDFELIVSDNASADPTETMVKSFRDSRIRYTRNSSNIGIRENWKQCLSLSTGEYITVLPDDDVMMPDNLERKVEILSSAPSIGLVHSKYHIIDEHGDFTRYDTNWGHGSDRGADAIEDRAEILTAQWNRINSPTVLFRNECVRQLGVFSDQLNLAFDWEYWLRIAVYYDVAFLAVPLIKWRLHSKTYTATHIGDNSMVKLKEDLLVKRIITSRHLHRIQNWRQVNRLVWIAMAERAASVIESLLEEGKRAEARELCRELCFTHPQLLKSADVMKVITKCVLGKRCIDFFKILTKAGMSYRS